MPGPEAPTDAGRPRAARLVSHPAFRRPAFGRHHPLSTLRQAAVLDLIAGLGWLAPGEAAEAPLPDRATLERVHTSDYLDALEAADAAGVASPDARRRYNLGSMECPVFPGLWERARATVGGAIRAAEIALSGQLAFHPAGGTHHGRPDRASGFCYLNDPVFAILRLLDAGVTRMLYVDLDAHHGDGVEDAFADDRRVRLLSIHEESRWPGTGGFGNTSGKRACNVPVPRGFNDAELRLVLDRVAVPLTARLGPEAVVVTLGADALAGDPLAGLDLSNNALWQATELFVEAAPAAVVLGGGGYNPWTTARLWAGLWARLAGYPIPAALPDAARAVLAALDCDLVEAEDRSPRWLDTIADPPEVGRGEVRPRVAELVSVLTCRLPADWS
jgi:acetoin utilization protein AcuC